MDFQRKIRAWLPLHKRPDSLQIPSSLNSYAQATTNSSLAGTTILAGSTMLLSSRPLSLRLR